MPAYHLVLVHSDGWQDLADFYALQREIEETAPDIKVFIASNDSASSLTRKSAAKRPTLIFSPIRLLKFKPDRGKIYAGVLMSKLEEVQRLSSAGIPVPDFEVLQPETVLDERIYGPLTVLKPSYSLSSFGSGVELWRTEAVRYKTMDQYKSKHPGSKAPMIAQRFIDCGYPMTCRVLTLFGAPIFTYLRQSTRPLSLPDDLDQFDQRFFMPMPPDIAVSLSRDPEILAFAAEVHAAMPEIALQACDIVREESSGKLYILEINPGGGTWMLSNHNSAGYRQVLQIDDLWAPFDALRTCAHVLIEKTRLEAE